MQYYWLVYNYKYYKPEFNKLSQQLSVTEVFILSAQNSIQHVHDYFLILQTVQINF